MHVRRRSNFLVAVVLMALGSSIGCLRSSEPEKLYAEAERLRLLYEKQAAHEAVAKYRDAMAAWTRKGDRRAAVRAAEQIGAIHAQLGALRESLQDYQIALGLARESADPSLESEVRSDIGIAQTLVSDREQAFEEAQTQCQTALELARRSASDRGAAKALNCLGEVAYHRQRPEQALQAYREAGRVWDKLGDRAGQAQTLLFQGYVHSDSGKFDLAQACYERARSLWTSLGDKRQQAITLVAEARLHARRGAYQEALNGFDAALAILQPMGDLVWEGATLTGMATVYQDMAENRSALKYFERALKLFETAGLTTASLEILGAAGEMYLALGDDTNALSRFERALALADEQGIQYWRAKALRFIGVVQLFRHAPRHAVEYLERSLAVQQSLGRASYLKLQARTRADLGEAHDALGQHDFALTDFDDAVALSRSAGDRVAEARGLFGLARTSVGRNDLKTAQSYIEGALKVAESLRTEVDNRDLRASYFASVYQWHELYVDVLMRLNKVQSNAGFAVTAFEASERARARSLLESLSGAEVDLRSAVDPDLLRRDQALKKAFDDWAVRDRQRASGDGKAEAAALAEEYQDLEYRYNQVQAEIRRRNPQYSALVRPQPVKLEDVQRQLLDRDTVLLEYSLGDQRSYLWAVSNKGYASYELPPRSVIEEAARHVYNLLTARLNATGEGREPLREARKADAPYRQEAARLSEMLLAPVASRIAGKRLLVVADGALQYLPFAALPEPGSRGQAVPLVLEHEIVSLPSASVVAVMRRETRGKEPPLRTVAVLADPVFEVDDPRLPNTTTGTARVERQAAPTGGVGTAEAERAFRGVGFLRDGTLNVPRLIATRQEADAIVRAAPEGTTLRALDFDASRATAMSAQLSQYRIVHFASHGVFNNEDPSLSGIILSMFDKNGRPQDGFLRLHDIYTLKIPAELVVLSACNTALGKPVKGEGLVGMVRGFMYAGAKRVVASYWKVDDEATGELMRRFYVEMLKQNRSPAAALRAAQLAMRQQHRWESPFYWAAFALQGEWK